MYVIKQCKYVCNSLVILNSCKCNLVFSCVLLVQLPLPCQLSALDRNQTTKKRKAVWMVNPQNSGRCPALRHEGKGFLENVVFKEVWFPVRVVCHQGSLSLEASHQGGLSSGWSLIRVVCHQGSLSLEASHQGGLSSGWPLIRVVSHQGGLSSGWSLIRVASHQGGLSSGWPLIRVVSESRQCVLIRMASHQAGVLSG